MEVSLFGPETLPSIHPKDPYQGFEEQFACDEDTTSTAMANHLIAKADTSRSLLRRPARTRGLAERRRV